MSRIIYIVLLESYHWECICLPLVPCTWITPGRGPLPGRICHRGSPEVAWVLHESDYSMLVLGIWPWSYLFLLFITVLRYWSPRPPRPYRGLLSCRPLHGLSYPWVSGGGTIDAHTWRPSKWSTLTLLLGALLGGSRHMFYFQKQLENLLCEGDSVNHSGARTKRKKNLLR